MVILIEMMLEVLIGVLVMEVDKVADEVTNMEVDKVTNMMAKIPSEDFSDIQTCATHFITKSIKCYALYN